MTNSDIEIEFAVNGYILRVAGTTCRIFTTVDEMTTFLNNHLDNLHIAIMKSRDTVDGEIKCPTSEDNEES